MISEKHLTWLEKRGIDAETAVRTGIYTVRRGQDGVPNPDSRGDILAFPYFESRREVNTKYRGPGKKFWQKTGGSKTFFNAEVLADLDALSKSDRPLIICEGEIDCLSFLQAGHPFAVSVPDGAPPARDQHGNLIEPAPGNVDDVDMSKDEKYAYIWNNRDRLARVKRFILATDGDEPGQRLRDELASRLGRPRCSFVTYPEGCKDANDVLVKYGRDGIDGLIASVKPYPVKGLYYSDDYPPTPPLKTFDIGFPNLSYRPDLPPSPSLALYRGAFMVVSGLPGSGKTTWTMQMAFNMARIHDWRCGIASFEMPVMPTLLDTLRGYYLGTPRRLWTESGLKEADRFIRDKFVFIDVPDDEDVEADAQWVIDRAHDAVDRDGIKLLLVDPWNEVEHKRRGGENVADYTNRAIRAFKRFARARQVATVIVAHPTKSAGVAAKNGEPMTLYDISDGATWANKAELGVIVYRQSWQDTLTTIAIKKIKFRGTGRHGDAYLTYDEGREAFID